MHEFILTASHYGLSSVRWLALGSFPELRFTIRKSVERVIMCMMFVWFAYNPWLSVGTWLGPQVTDPHAFQSGWVMKAFLIIVMLATALGLAGVVYNKLGTAKALTVLLATSLLAYMPFNLGWFPTTPINVFYATWFFVLPVLAGAGLSTGFWTRYLSGTLPTQSVGGHVNATVINPTDHNVTPLDAHHHT